MVELSVILKLLDSTAGREKLMRALQYWSRFFSFYAYKSNYSKGTILFWKTLASQLSLSRMLFRVGQPLNHVNWISQCLKISDPTLRATNVARHSAYFLYMFCDTLMWLHLSGIKKFSPATFGRIYRTGMKLWFLALAANVASSVVKLWRGAGKKEEHQKQLAWDLLDAAIPVTALKWIEFDDGFVGICGLITSLMGLEKVTQSLTA
ncbi:peroxisomal membrane protein PMP27 [Trichomonascus vanleenenianus]|uniref:PEX11 family protein n=1 Tax=Trichomonascus vanleenenianus TaxID=2268995 RepID=UPI003EC9CE4E